MDTEPDVGRRRLRRAALGIAVALVVVTGGFAAFFGWSWWSAAHDDSVRFAQHRDEVLQVGEQEIVNFNTIDYRNVDAGLDQWLNSSTGTLHDEILQSRDANKPKIQQSKSTFAGKVVQAAVTELDDRAGTATLIALVDTVVTPDGGQAATKRNEYEARLTRTGGGWKLSVLSPVS